MASFYSHNSDHEIFLTAELLKKSSLAKLLLIPENKLDFMEEKLKFFAPEENFKILPPLDIVPYDVTSPDLKIVLSRIKTIYEIIASNDNFTLITSPKALARKIPAAEFFIENSFVIKNKTKINRDALISFLNRSGFIRVELVTGAGEFAVRGSILDIALSNNETENYRIDFFGDEIESIKIFNILDQRSIGTVDELLILPSSEIILDEKTISSFRQNYRKTFGAEDKDQLFDHINDGRKYQGMEEYLPLFYDKLSNLIEFLPNFEFIIYQDAITEYENLKKEISSHYNSRKDLNNKILPPELLWNLDLKLEGNIIKKESSAQEIPLFFTSAQSKSVITLLEEYFKTLSKKLIISCFSEGSSKRLSNMLEQHNLSYNNISQVTQATKGVINLCINSFDYGFEELNFILISEQVIFGDKIKSIRKAKRKKKDILQDIGAFQKNDYVVHIEYGIGIFRGLEKIEISGIIHDCILIEYDGGDKLYIPVESLELISRYSDSFETVKLDKLGTLGWQTRKAKIKERIKLAAAKLLETAAEREAIKVNPITFNPEQYDEFCALFPHAETEDQINAIEDIKNDLIHDKLMDRLICGDVGFGKTEVAMRASFMATKFGNNSQVAMVAPTTLLAKQHFDNFSERFKNFDIRVEMLSRAVPLSKAKIIKEELKNGEIDIIIGTHALLSKSINFHNLSLLIIDEEQHFGVEQKETIKSKNPKTHILTLTATPIPRTMQLSLSGIKSMSILATAPFNRQAVTSYITYFDEIITREAILREYSRGGKCFFVCPKISDVEFITPQLRGLLPNLPIATLHGQMETSKIDQIISDFTHGKYALLISTPIIESGLDIPLANTIFIYKAESFGLAALYQLKGRVGRGKEKAFAYFLIEKKKLSRTAEQRIEAIRNLNYLGAGFSVASYDMDIRGYGNLLGSEQSGHIREVGIELYQQMLNEAVLDLKHETSAQKEWSPDINIEGLNIIIPENYIQDISLRLKLYRKIASFNDEQELEEFAIEMIDRFGVFGPEVANFIKLVQIKIICKNLNIDNLKVGNKGILISFKDNICNNQEELLPFIMKNKSFKIRPDQKIFYSIVLDTVDKRIEEAIKFLKLLPN